MPATMSLSHNIYVIELNKKIWTEDWRFRKANPQWNGIKECLYVGITSHSPKERFEKHKSGYRSKKGHKISSRVVEKYGKYLRPSMYTHLNPMTKKRAVLLEKRFAEELKRKGYAVWWN